MPSYYRPGYSAVYNDESADIPLISEDNFTFKVFSYDMKSNSSILRDLLQDPNLTPTPIPIDTKASDLALFLDYMLAYPPPQISKWSTAKRIFSLADKWGCKVVHERLVFRMANLVISDPWETFCFASHEDDLVLARKALKEMDRDARRKNMDVRSMPSADAASPSIPYLMGLLSQLIVHAHLYGGNNWVKISDDFTPRK